MAIFGVGDLPADNPLNRVYRFGAGVMGAGLLLVGGLGFAGALGFFDTMGNHVLGLSTNTLLSAISVIVGLILIAGAVIGGNISAGLNTVFGVLFLLSGLANEAVIRTSANFLNFSMRNVIFSFVSGVLLLTFGLYGRVSGALPPDNPFHRARLGLDPATGAVVDLKEEETGMPVGHCDESPVPLASDTGTDPRQLNAADGHDEPGRR